MSAPKSGRCALALIGILAAFGFSNTAAEAAGTGQAAVIARGSGRTLMRFPTLLDQTVVFEAHGNLWSVARTGVNSVGCVMFGLAMLSATWSSSGARVQGGRNATKTRVRK